MGAPKRIQLGPDKVEEEKVITGHIDGIAYFMTREDAISLINELSGVLLAYEYGAGYSESNAGNPQDLRDTGS